MWFLCCDDEIFPETYVLGVFKELSDALVTVSRCFFDVPEKKLYIVKASSEQYWLKCDGNFKGKKGKCITVPK